MSYIPEVFVYPVVGSALLLGLGARKASFNVLPLAVLRINNEVNRIKPHSANNVTDLATYQILNGLYITFPTVHQQ